jgi:hypothetical protein
MVCFALRLRVYWMGKSSLFPPVIRVVMRWLGGIAVNRSAAGNLVQGTVDAFHANERLTVIVPPEGTRGKVTHWKTGFYYIALGAGVPIALGYLDFGRKAGGIGRMFMPTGDIAADMEEIKAFYSGIQGKIHSSSVPTISRPSNSLPFQRMSASEYAGHAALAGLFLCKWRVFNLLCSDVRRWIRSAYLAYQ